MAELNARDLKLLFGSTPTEYTADIIKAEITSDDKDDLTFGEIQSGSTKNFSIELTILQNMASGGLWAYLFTNAGDTVDFVMKPYGNTTASATQPHIVGEVTITEKPTVGGEADTEGRFTSDVVLKVVGDYTLDDGA
jgi:hypothetical protein